MIQISSPIHCDFPGLQLLREEMALPTAVAQVLQDDYSSVQKIIKFLRAIELERNKLNEF